MLFVSGVLDKWLNETYWNRLFHLETPSKREVDFTSDDCWIEELNGKRPVRFTMHYFQFTIFDLFQR